MFDIPKPGDHYNDKWLYFCEFFFFHSVKGDQQEGLF